MADLCIMLLTYNRLEFARMTLVSVLSQVKYTRGDVRLHIASDGDSDEYITNLLAGREATVSNSRRGGYGANYNAATQIVHSLANVEYVLPLEDDWECISELDLDAYTLALDAGLGCVRLGYLGFTQPLLGRVDYLAGGHYLQFDPNSPEPHTWAGHPRVETVAWERGVGPWPEGIGAGATEFEVAHWPAARRGIAWPMSVNPKDGYGVFTHIGSVKAEDIV